MIKLTQEQRAKIKNIVDLANVERILKQDLTTEARRARLGQARMLRKLIKEKK